MQRHNPRITVVNDNPDFLELMHEILAEDSGYDVTTIDADTIHDDIEPIRLSRPDLLIVDLRSRNDPLDGWALLQSIRADAELGELPIILCSGDLQALQEHTLETDRDPKVATLAKPFQVEDMETLVRQFVGEAARSNR